MTIRTLCSLAFLGVALLLVPCAGAQRGTVLYAGAASSQYTVTTTAHGNKILAVQGYVPYVFPTDSTGLEFIFGNSYGKLPEKCGPAYALKASLEYPVDSGKFYPLLFRGRDKVTVQPCDTITNDPWPGHISAKVSRLANVRFLVEQIYPVSNAAIVAGWNYGEISGPLALYPYTTTKVGTMFDGYEEMRYSTASPLVVADCEITAGSNLVTSSTLGFLYYQDQGQTIKVAGAGPNRTDLVTTIATIPNNNTKTATLLSPASTSVTGATCSLTPSDKTGSSSNPILNSQRRIHGFAPIGVLAVQTGPQKGVVFMGDSISYGIGTNFCAGSWAAQSMNPEDAAVPGRCTEVLSRVPFLNMSMPGERAADLTTDAGHIYRFRQNAHGKYIGGMINVNDYGGYTVAQVEAADLLLYAQESVDGAKPFDATLTPRTTSVDKWQSLERQTVSQAEMKRVAINEWKRDGAPMDCTTGQASAVGATGPTIMHAPYYNYTSTAAAHPSVKGFVGKVCSAQGKHHPLDFIFELADSVEEGRNSGLWKTGLTGDGVHPTVQGHFDMGQVAGATFAAVMKW